MNKALLVDHETGDISLVTIDGTEGIRKRIRGYVRGETIAALGGNTVLRKWSSCSQPAFLRPSGLQIIDAYNSVTVQPVDVPISPAEYKQSGSTIGSTPL
jgi:hypothetical protein